MKLFIVVMLWWLNRTILQTGENVIITFCYVRSCLGCMTFTLVYDDKRVAQHEDPMPWKRFLYYWHFIMGIHMQAAGFLTQKDSTETLQWRHNGRVSISNHQPRECLLNRSIMCRSKKTSKLRVIGLCAGSSPETGEFPAQRAGNAENVSIWWRHHEAQLWCGFLCNITGKSQTWTVIKQNESNMQAVVHR